jgi:NADH-quinone oxidoreductase subunit M
MLRLIKNVLFGPIQENSSRANVSLSKFEGATAIPIIALILYFGLHPAPILNSFEKEDDVLFTEQGEQEFSEEMEEIRELIKKHLESEYNMIEDSTSISEKYD